MTWRPVLDRMQELGLVASKDKLMLTAAGEKALTLASPSVRELRQTVAKPLTGKWRKVMPPEV